ncbi:peptide chain release factor-like protein [Myroides indicus]|uniref:Ribosome-associated protein n=1 Tax=Myroides indicus TaxID=1323422 RepID=A0A4R7ERF8_9FLAO|nr:peptide chain release factor-like protein [Myroides indicus]TDS55922.1 ribosome-associated protein [Myroides indicus]
MNQEIIKRELEFKAVRSSGAGGQNMNKVSTKVILSWSLANTKGLNEEEQKILFIRLKNRLTKEGLLLLDSDATRSQLKNKNIVIERFFELLYINLIKQKNRKKTIVPKRIQLKRRENKRVLSIKKALRKRPDF